MQMRSRLVFKKSYVAEMVSSSSVVGCVRLRRSGIRYLLRSRHIRFLVSSFVSLMLLGSSVEAAEELISVVYAEASQAWASQLGRLMSEPAELHAVVNEDGVDRHITWLNYSTPPRRMIRSESARFLHVYSVNDRYQFDISARADGNKTFWLNELKSQHESAAPPECYELFLPEGTFLGYPLVCLVRRDLVNILDVKPVASSPSQLLISGRVRKSQQVKEQPFALFAHHFVQDTEIEVCVSRDNDWKLVSARVTYPHGSLWEQQNRVDASGKVVTQVVAKHSGTVTREYTRTLTKGPLPPFDDASYYLPHYGLSESTAGYLMGSRRYILVFCGLFFGAILFRILASVVKRRQARNG